MTTGRSGTPRGAARWSGAPRAARRRAVAGVVTVVGVIGAVATVVWAPNPVLYVAAVAVAALGGAATALLLLGGRRARSVTAAAVVLAVALLAVVVPSWAATREQRGEPRWTFPTMGRATILHADGERLVLSDRRGVLAVDLRSGERAWSLERTPEPDFMWSSESGHLLLRDDEGEVLLVSPEGSELWRSGDLPAPFGGAPWAPIAVSDGVVVTRTCDAEPPLDDPTSPCRYAGIGPEGRVLWQERGAVGPRGERGSWNRTDGTRFSAVRLPEVVVVRGTGPGAVEARVLDAATGTEVARTGGEGVSVVTGTTVLNQLRPGETGETCPTTGVGRDARWEGTAPCLSGLVEVRGPWVYAPERPRSSDRSVQWFALDTRTGRRYPAPALTLETRIDPQGRVLSGTADEVHVVAGDGPLLRASTPANTQRWSYEAPTERLVRVRLAEGAATLRFDPGRGHNPFTATDRDDRRDRIVALDSRTGRVTGEITRPRIREAVPVGRGQVVVSRGDEDLDDLQDAELVLIGSEPAP